MMRPGAPRWFSITKCEPRTIHAARSGSSGRKCRCRLRGRVNMRRILVCLFLTSTLSTAQPDHTTTKADVDRWMTDLSNWGRWGKDDQLGALNFITPAKRKQAAALVKEGVSVSLAHDVLKD